jgi:hypothetical protein
MDLPLAIKEQEGVAGSLNAAGSLFTGILCPTVYRCPNCRKIYKVILGPGDVFLGKGHRTCSKCQQEFRDRSKEWNVVSLIDRAFFLFPMVVWGWILVALIVCVLSSWLEWTVGSTPILMLLLIFFATPFMAWIALRAYQIVRSIRRFHLGGKEKGA